MSTLPSSVSEDRSLSSLHWIWIAVAISAFLTFEEKPWAVLHAQPWAEDSSVHMLDNDQLGAAAILKPYRGYLHLLPRLIAWSGGHVVGIAALPRFYALATLLAAIGIYLRFASTRLRLPGKAWIILAFVLAAHSGEVFLNLTNLHWITSFLLLAQVLMDPPASRPAWSADLLIVLVVGLTGPFVILYAPLFAWRLWRERDRYSASLLAVVGACSGVQGFFVATTGAQYFHVEGQSRAGMFFDTVATRLAVWPLLGPKVAMALPTTVTVILGFALLAAIVLSAVRQGPTRLLRLQVLAAFLVIGTICMIRVRPDTFPARELENGDSYFFIPRVLLLWMVVLALSDAPALLRWGAIALGSLAVLANVTGLSKPAPVDFDWVAHCDPIRQGIPAKIRTVPEGWIFDYPGKPQYLGLNDDWYPQEQSSKHHWRWSPGASTATVGNSLHQPVHLHFALIAPHPTRVSIRNSGGLVWTGPIGEKATPVDFSVPAGKESHVTLAFSSDTPGREEAPGRRTLAFAMYDWRVDPPAP